MCVMNPGPFMPVPTTTTTTTTTTKTPCYDCLIPDDVKCMGNIVSNGTTGEKIIGGEETVPNSWPWIVRMEWGGAGGGGCGGSILNNEWILTGKIF